ncbi:MAG: hypothetical protein ABID83_05655, partial [Candidatus Omnitrophota bacterium]
MAKKFLLIALALFVLNPCFTRAARGEESFYNQLTRGVVRLEHFEEAKKEGAEKAEIKSIPEGTAFFILYNEDLYVVSTRHVVEKGYDLHAYVKSRNRETETDEIILMKLPRDRWVFHPEGGDKDTHGVDIAVMKISFIKDRDIKHFTHYDPGEGLIDQFAEKDPEPPKDILVFGFPGNIGFELKERNPMGRKGIISFKGEEPFIK